MRLLIMAPSQGAHLQLWYEHAVDCGHKGIAMQSKDIRRRIEEQLPRNYVKLFGERVAGLLADGLFRIASQSRNSSAGSLVDVPIKMDLIEGPMSPDAKVAVIRLAPLSVTDEPVSLSSKEFAGIASGGNRAVALRVRDELI